MKLRITGASNFVNRMFEACGSYQWAREFLKNSLEAEASKIEFGIEWQAVAKDGVYRRTAADDGVGMDREQLLEFFSTLGTGAKKIGGVHDNFGVGAKIAALPWNPEGLVVISYKNGQGSMIWIVLDPDSGDYELVEFEIEGEKNCVIEPTVVDGIDWATVRPNWLKDHGTVIVLLGSEEYPDTVLGNPQAGERDIKGLSVYLNSRFWDLSNVEVKVVELRSEKKSQWPQGLNDRDDSRRPNNRQVMGACHFLTKVKAAEGKLAAQGTKLLDGDRVLLDWYLWEGTRPAIHSYAKKNGYIAVRYNQELFQISANKVHFRWFGVVESKVQQNLTLVIEPQLYQPSDGRWGIHADQSRNRLIFTGNGEKGVEIPLSDWGLEFAEDMPDAIREAIRAARGAQTGSVDDEDYRKRLQDKFGNRWKVKLLVKARGGEHDAVEGSDTNESVEVPASEPRGGRRRRRKSVKVVHGIKASAGGSDRAVERESPVDVPKYRFGGADEFEQPWHLALWAPHDPDGPTVVINQDAPILQEVVHFHQEQYPDVYAEEVANTVRQVFGEVASCKIAHSQKLAVKVPEEELDRVYRTEPALTVALMGLIAEESLIAQRLGKLGRKKPAVPAA
ncbi:MAG TPA: ATP-binding protein [Vicinamibacterales bacterium]|nr:ATP-binding protein [Vicinamibacterales bacterium]